MQQAINATELTLNETELTTERQELPGTEEATGQHIHSVPRSGSPIHYSRSYNPDGAAGGYQGL